MVLYKDGKVYLKIVYWGMGGSGKTTIFKIIAGLIDPLNGDVLYNGYSVTDIPREVLWDRISYVSQQSVLFDDTIEGNIRSGNLKAAEDYLTIVAKSKDMTEIEQNKLYFKILEEGMEDRTINDKDTALFHFTISASPIHKDN